VSKLLEIGCLIVSELSRIGHNQDIDNATGRRGIASHRLLYVYALISFGDNVANFKITTLQVCKSIEKTVTQKSAI
jgi:hypothetical protein